MERNALAVVIDNDAAVTANLLLSLNQGGHAAKVFDSVEHFFTSAKFNDYGCVILGVDLFGRDGLRVQECWDHTPATPPLILIAKDMQDRTIGKAIDMGSIAIFDQAPDAKPLLRAVDAALGMYAAA